jgi:LacI family transcriptional regulator
LKKARVQVGIRDVADRALVSIGTVSRVLNNHPNVETSLRLRVLNAVNELGYVHRQRQTDRFTGDNFQLLKLDKNKIKHVTFCYRASISAHATPLLGNTYFSLVLHGAEVECRQRNVNLRYRLIEDSAAALPSALEALLESKTEALVLVSFLDHTLVKGLLESGLPVVLVDHYFSDLPLDAIINDSYHGAYHLMQYLMEQGHRRIAFVNGLPHYTIQRRFDAYRRALEDSGIPFNPAWVLQGDLQVEGGNNAAEEFIKNKLDCTAVFCANDETAFGFIQRLADYKIKVPRDISVVGFDDVEAARFVTPPLTTIRADAPSLGQIAIRRLLERANNPDIPFTQTMVRSELIERNSVQKINGHN